MTDVYDYGLLIPDGTDFALMPEALQQQINLLGAEWPDFPAIGTRVYNGMGLIYMRLKAKLSKAELEALIAQFGLPWLVMGIRSAYKINPIVTGVDEEGNDIIEMQYDTVLMLPRDPSILNYANDAVDTIDEEGNVTMRRPTLDDAIYIATYAGTDPIKL